MTVNILGSEWEIVRTSKEQDKSLETCDGYADYTIKKIVVLNAKREPDSVEDLEHHMKKVTRHEIVHAFFFESGLFENSLQYERSWATNEEMVDWIAFQGEKIYKAWQEAGAV